ncbi:hypothetical protein ACXIZN_41645 [Amycolatopsis sp. TRM77291]
MRSEREVHVTWARRTAVIDDREGWTHDLSYPGIAITRRRGGRPVGEVWLPVGSTEPTHADDEALTAALRTAWHWSRSAA